MDESNVTVTAQQWYKLWGETRNLTGQSPPDYTFQGQREHPGWGLKHFGARWLDAVLGRFAQADSIVPGAGNPMAWDRYAGLMNNPLKYTDPSVHCVFGLDTVVCVIAVIIGGVVAVSIYNETVPAPQREQLPVENRYHGHDCTASLTTCNEQGKLSSLESGQVSEGEFNTLLETVATDLEDGIVLPNAIGGKISGRGSFDTPFYNGGGRGGLQDPPYEFGQLVCIGDQGCWGRTEINYVAEEIRLIP